MRVVSARLSVTAGTSIRVDGASDRTPGFAAGAASVRLVVPVAHAASQSVLSLPIHPSLTPDDITYIAECLARFA